MGDATEMIQTCRLDELQRGPESPSGPCTFLCLFVRILTLERQVGERVATLQQSTRDQAKGLTGF